MNAPLWSLDELVTAVKGRPTGPLTGTISGISIDSRSVAPGEAFFAIRGDSFDGHDFVSMALAGGAVTAVVAQSRLAGLGHVHASLVIVDDPLAAMVKLAGAARTRSDAQIAAVTGSVGKTGTKEMLARALAPGGPVHASPASFNNHWGVPLSLSRLPRTARYGIFEIGMNHAGEITPLVRLVRPQVAIVTNVEPVHLQFFDSVDDIARAKAEIFLGVESGGAAIINFDNPYSEFLAALALEAGVERIVGFGEHEDATARLEAMELKPDRSSVMATILGQEVSYELGAPGRHMIQNSLAVLAAVALMGGDLAEASAALADMDAPAGRGARHRLDIGGAGAILIDESYNANPASMRAAIALLGQANPVGAGRRIAILGEMLELGDEGPAMHAALAASLAEAGVDTVFLAGEAMEALWHELPESQRGGYADTAAELEPMIGEGIAAGDVIMIKGSNASRMGPLARALKGRFAPDEMPTGHGQGQEIA